MACTAMLDHRYLTITVRLEACAQSPFYQVLQSVNLNRA